MKNRLGELSGTGAALVVSIALSVPGEAAERPRFQEGEVIVKFSRGTAATGMATAARTAHGGALVARTMAAVGNPRVALVRFPKDVPVMAMVDSMKRQAGVEYAEPNYIAYIPRLGTAQPEAPPDKRAVRSKTGGATLDPREALSPGQAASIDRAQAQFLNYPNDSNLFNNQGWQWMGADVIWPDAAPNPMIAVIDSGVDYTHPDLAGRVVKGGDWVNDDPDPMDDNGHGTHVAGIAGALVNNGQGMAGVAKSQIYAVKVLGAQGSGTFFDIAQGIAQAANNATVKILNLSLGGPCGSATLTSAMELAATKGKLIVVAMGNDNFDVSGFEVCPASYTETGFNAVTAPVTIAVGANGRIAYGDCPGTGCYSYLSYACKAEYSNTASWMPMVAPGTRIYSTTPYNRPFWLGLYEGVSGNYAYLDGTSMAAPFVAGGAARTFSAMPAGTTAAQVKARLVSSGTPDIFWGQPDSLDTDGDGVADAPCWPTGSGFNVATRGLMLPGAMRRAEASGRLLDANGALGLMGGKVTAYSGTAAKGTAGVVDVFRGDYRVLNIPMNNVVPYDFTVTKAGYAMGNQKFTRYLVDDCSGAGVDVVFCVYNANEQLSVGAMSSTRYNLVTDWISNQREVDQYVFGPSASMLANCSIGYGGSCGTGELIVAPFMKHLHDGGPASGSGSTEFSQIKAPLQPQGVGTPYKFFATDYCDTLSGIPCGGNMVYENGVFRLWKGGVILATVRASIFDSDLTTHNCELVGGSTDCDAWHIGDLSSAGVFTPRNVFGVFDTTTGDPDGVLPYRWRPDERTGGGGPRGLPSPAPKPRKKQVSSPAE